MKSEVLEIKEIGSGDYKHLEIKLRVENDDGEVLPQYKWFVNHERANKVLESDEEMKEELAHATHEALGYMQVDKSQVKNAKVQERKLDLERTLTNKVKRGLTKKGIKDYLTKEQNEVHSKV
jgi:hypothetical protein